MALTLPSAERARIHAHVVAGYPHEVVGVLAGSAADHTVVRVVSLVNERADSPANRYSVSSLVIWRATQALEDEGLTVLGYYHSHPDHPARYSDFDRDHSLPNLSYLIVSVVQGVPVDWRSWRLEEDRLSMSEEPIIPKESP